MEAQEAVENEPESSVRQAQFRNIRSIIVTLEVSKPERSSPVKAAQPENINRISKTLEVSK